MSTVSKALAAMALTLLLHPVSRGWADEETPERVWSFDEEAAGSLPQGWQVAETSGRGTPATWQIVADSTAPSPSHAIAVTRVENSGGTYNLLMAKHTSFGDLDIELMVKAVAGEEDQGGGPIWRARSRQLLHRPLESAGGQLPRLHRKGRPAQDAEVGQGEGGSQGLASD